MSEEWGSPLTMARQSDDEGTQIMKRKPHQTKAGNLLLRSKNPQPLALAMEAICQHLVLPDGNYVWTIVLPEDNRVVVDTIGERVKQLILRNGLAYITPTGRVRLTDHGALCLSWYQNVIMFADDDPGAQLEELLRRSRGREGDWPAAEPTEVSSRDDHFVELAMTAARVIRMGKLEDDAPDHDALAELIVLCPSGYDAVQLFVTLRRHHPLVRDRAIQIAAAEIRCAWIVREELKGP